MVRFWLQLVFLLSILMAPFVSALAQSFTPNPNTPIQTGSRAGVSGTVNTVNFDWQNSDEFHDCGQSCLKQKARANYSLHHLYLAKKIEKILPAYEAYRRVPSGDSYDNDREEKKNKFEELVNNNLRKFCPGGSDREECFRVYRTLHSDHILPKMRRANLNLKKGIAELADERVTIGGISPRYEVRPVPVVEFKQPAKKPQMPDLPTAEEVVRRYRAETLSLNQEVREEQENLIQDFDQSRYQPSPDEYILFEESAPNALGEKTSIPKKSCDGAQNCDCRILAGYCIDTRKYQDDLEKYRQHESDLDNGSNPIDRTQISNFLKKQPMSLTAIEPTDVDPQDQFGAENLEAYQDARYPLVRRTLQVIQSHNLPTGTQTVDFGKGNREIGSEPNPYQYLGSLYKKDIDFRQTWNARRPGSPDQNLPQVEKTDRMNRIGVSVSPETLEQVRDQIAE